MHDQDKDIKDMLAQAEIPAHSPDLSERIIATAIASGHAHQHTATSQSAIKQKMGFSEWWANMRAFHGQKMAAAAAMVALAIVVFDPAGKITQHYLDEQKLAEMERYTVDGVPLLMDISVLTEQDLMLEEIVEFSEG